MRSIKPISLCIVFVVGAVAGWGLHLLLQPSSDPPTTVAINPNSAPPTTGSAGSPLPQANQSAIATSPLQDTSNTLSSNNVPVGNDTLNDWIDINERSSYQQQLQALQYIDTATDSELEALVNSLEHDNQRFYERAWLYRAALQRWSEIDSQAVVWHLDQLMQSDNLNNVDRQVEAVRALATSHFDLVSQWLANMNPEQNHHQLMTEQVNSVLAESNPEAALMRVLESNATGRSQQQSIQQIIMQWSHQQPLEAIEWIEQNPDLVKGNHVKEMALMNVMARDPEAGLAMIPSVDNAQLVMQLEAEYASQLAIISGLQAYEWANSLTNNASRRNAQQRVLETWSYSNPEAAMEFVSSLPPGELNNDALYSMYSSAAYNKSLSDPAGAMSWADTLPTQFQQMARQTAFHSWVEQSPTDALQWIEYSADPSQREAFMQSVAPMLSNTDLELSLRLYPDMSTETQTQMVYGIVQQLYSTDPASAENWVGTLSPGPANTEAQTMLIMMLADQDPLSALDLASQQPQAQRSQLLAQLSYTLAEQQPSELENWLATADISEEERQMMSEAIATMRQGGNPYYNGMPSPGQIDFYDEQLEY